jgi:hypothetical protein
MHASLIVEQVENPTRYRRRDIKGNAVVLNSRTLHFSTQRHNGTTELEEYVLADSRRELGLLR